MSLFISASYFNRFDAELNPWIGLVDKFTGMDVYAAVVVLDSLAALKTVKDNLETIIKVVRHRRKVDVKLQLEVVGNHLVPVLATLEKE